MQQFPNFTMRGSLPSFGSLGAGMMQGGGGQPQMTQGGGGPSRGGGPVPNGLRSLLPQWMIDGQAGPPPANAPPPGDSFSGTPTVMQQQPPTGHAQALAQLFPQFMTPNSGMSGPQFGRSPPSWQNDWAMTPQGTGVPLPEGIGPWQTVADFVPPAAPTPPPANTGPQPWPQDPYAPGVTPDQLQAYYDQMTGGGGNASGGWQ